MLVRVFFALLLLPTATFAQDSSEWRTWPFGKKWTIGAGAFLANLDTKVRIDSSNGITGTQLDFEQNLGLADAKGLPIVHLAWRFARRHQLNFTYFDLNRKGTEITEATIRFGDLVFNADLPVSSLFDVATTSVAYQYSLVSRESTDVAVGIGLAVQDIRLGLAGNTDTGFLDEQAHTTTPVPTITLTGSYAFTNKFYVTGALGYIAASLDLGSDDELHGEVLEAGVTFIHQTFEHVRFGLGYSYFDLNVDWTDKGKFTDVQYNYHGPMLSVAMTF